MDGRLEQIREIILGGQVERLENKQRNLSLRVDAHQNQLIAVVEDLREQMSSIKTEWSEKHLKNLDTLQGPIEDVLSEIQNSMLQWWGQMTERVQDLETQNQQKSEAMENLRKEQGSKSTLGKGSEALSNLVDRIKRLEDSEGQNNQLLKNELQSLRKRQERFEANISEILDNLADAISDKLQNEQQKRQALSEETGALKSLVHDGLQGLLDEQEKMKRQDFRPSTGGTPDDEAVQAWQGRMERKMEDAVLRMETRMMTMLEMQNKYQAPTDPEAEKKKALKATLKKLSDLLDD